MKFQSKSNGAYYEGTRRNFHFLIARYGENAWYLCAWHKKKDIRYNSLWFNLSFKDINGAQAFCRKFYWKLHKCSGKDVK